jgi:NAD(P)-dependent dehydrogenase (short-subunit alcohol dehydrogenase family)
VEAMMGRFDGQTVVVTGGAMGIGAAIVDRFARDGASVAILDVDSQGARREERLRSEGASVRFYRCDVGNEEQVRESIEEAARALGPIRILVNNAGVNSYFDATEMTSADWDGVFAVDLKGAWHCSKHALPFMQAAGGGSVINIASIHAFMTLKGMFPYAAAKSGLLGLTRSLALDYAAHAIRVNAICPGWIRSHLVEEWLARQPDPAAAEASVLSVHPLGRIGTPADIANLACFLASDEATFITGSTMLIDGGLSARFAT